MISATVDPNSTRRRVVRCRRIALSWLVLSLAVPGLAAGASLFRADPFHTDSLTAANPATPWRQTAATACPTSHPTAQPWTLAEVVNQALCANPQTRQAWANARAQAAQLGVTKSQYLPSLNISGNASRGRTIGGALQTPVQNRFDPSLSINYLLFDFGARSAAVTGARASLLAADWTQNATLQNVMLSAVQAYYQTFATGQAAQAALTSEKSSRIAFEAARYRHQVGAAALADELQARTAWSQARLNRQKAEGQARIAHGTLANVLGLDADTSIKLTAPALQTPTSAERRSVRQLIESAKRARPDLAAAEAQVEASAANVKQAKAAGLPTFSVFANSGYNYISGTDNSRDWTVGLSVNVPLFTGYGDTYKVRAAESELASQQAQRNQLEQQITLEVWRSYQNLRTARDTYASSLDLLASAREAERAALGRYKAGVGNIVDLLNAEASLADARLQKIQAQFDWYTSRAALAQAVGRLQPDGTAAPPR